MSRAVRCLGCMALLSLTSAPTKSSAEVRLTNFKDSFVENVLVGAAPSFVAVQLLRSPEAKASEVISFNNRPKLGTRLCLQIVSQDGRYSASGTIDVFGATEGVQSINLPLSGDKKKYVAALLERELAIELSYRPTCNAGRDGEVHAAAWFGTEKPSGVVSFLFQALNNDAYLVADQAQSRQRQKCQKTSSGTISSTAAINSICQLGPAVGDVVRQIDIQIFDPFGDLDKAITLKVPSK
jgi:hypothetical protein